MGGLISSSLGALALTLLTALAYAQELECTDWQAQHPEWLWCDDFESDAALEQSYFDVNRAGGRLRVSNDVRFGGTSSLRGTYIPDKQDAGSIKLSIGKTPVAPKRYTDRNFDEVYWRFYMRTSANWTGNAFKVTRATIFTDSNWSQAAIGHLWEDSTTGEGLGLDPASGVVGDRVVTTKYNDFANLRWLGKRNGSTQVYSAENREKWFCIEVHMKLNTPGASDGLFEYWINDKREAFIDKLNWRGAFTTYGINAILMENYRNEPAPHPQDRYFDNFVVSRSRIGCYGSTQPKPPTDVRAE